MNTTRTTIDGYDLTLQPGGLACTLKRPILPKGVTVNDRHHHPYQSLEDYYGGGAARTGDPTFDGRFTARVDPALGAPQGDLIPARIRALLTAADDLHPLVDGLRLHVPLAYDIAPEAALEVGRRLAGLAAALESAAAANPS